MDLFHPFRILASVIAHLVPGRVRVKRVVALPLAVMLALLLWPAASAVVPKAQPAQAASSVTVATGGATISADTNSVNGTGTFTSRP